MPFAFLSSARELAFPSFAFTPHAGSIKALRPARYRLIMKPAISQSENYVAELMAR